VCANWPDRCLLIVLPTYSYVIFSFQMRITRNSKRARDADSTIGPAPTVKRICHKRRHVLRKILRDFAYILLLAKVLSTKRRYAESTMISLTPKRPRSVPVDPNVDLSGLVTPGMDISCHDEFSPLSSCADPDDSEYDDLPATPCRKVVERSARRLVGRDLKLNALKYTQATDVMLASLPDFAPRTVHG